MEPVIARHLLDALRDSGRVAHLFAERCLAGLQWNLGTVAAHLAGSFAADVIAAGRDGYEAAARRRGRPSMDA